MDVDSDRAVKLGVFEKGLRAPFKGFGLLSRQV